MRFRLVDTGCWMSVLTVCVDSGWVNGALDAASGARPAWMLRQWHGGRAWGISTAVRTGECADGWGGCGEGAGRVLLAVMAR